MTKKLNILFLSVLFILMGCNQDAKKKSETNTEDTEHKVKYLTTEEFKTKVFNYQTNKDWKYEGDIPCIVDFYATWCGPCKKIAPILEELAKEYDGKINIYKVDTDKEKELAGAFQIRSIPTILFVPLNGKPQIAQGALPKESFLKAINELLLVNKTK